MRVRTCLRVCILENLVSPEILLKEKLGYSVFIHRLINMGILEQIRNRMQWHYLYLFSSPNIHIFIGIWILNQKWTWS